MAILKSVQRRDDFLGVFYAPKSCQNASKIDAGKESKSEAKIERGGILSVVFLNEFLMKAESLRPLIHSKKTE